MPPLGDFSEGANDSTTTANLNLNINDVQVSKLQQVANLSNQIAANSSAMARFTADYIGYLQQIPALQRQIGSSPQAMAGGNGLGMGAGALGLVAGVQSAAASEGTGTRVSPPAPPSTDADNSGLDLMSPTELAAYNSQLAANNASTPMPASIFRRRSQNEVVERGSRGEGGGEGGEAGRGEGNGASPFRRTPEGSIFDRFSEYLEHGTRIAGGLQTATSGGQMGSGLVRLQQALNFGSLARLAPVVGTAAAGYEAYHIADEQLNQSNELGRMRGGDATQGAQYQAQIAQMALNPFLTNEQSRQIVMAGLQEGYSGKEFDSVTKFMAANLSGMNIQVADSVKLLQTNIEQGSQSLNGLSAQLGTLKQAAGTSNTSLEESSSSFINTSSSLVSAGSSGQLAGQAALMAGNLFQNTVNGDTNPLKGQGGAIVTAGSNSTSVNSQIIAMQGIQNTSAEELPSKIQGDTYVKYQMELITKYANQFMAEDPDHAVIAFRQWFNSTFGLNYTESQASELLQQAIGGNLYGSAQSHQQQTSGVGKGGQLKSVNQSRGLSRPFSSTASIGDNLKSLGHEALGRALSVLEPGFLGRNNAVSRERNSQYAAANTDRIESSLSDSSYNVGELETQYKAYGGNLQYVDANGNRHDFNQNIGSDSQLLNNITTGKYRLVQKGAARGTSTTLSNLQYGTGFATSEQLQGANISGELKISLTQQAQQFLGLSQNPVKLTQNQAKANSGADGATANTPPVGDR